MIRTYPAPGVRRRARVRRRGSPCPGRPGTRGNEPARERGRDRARTHWSRHGGCGAQPAEFPVIGAGRGHPSDGPCGHVTRGGHRPGRGGRHLPPRSSRSTRTGLSRATFPARPGPRAARTRSSCGARAPSPSSWTRPRRASSRRSWAGHSAYGPGEVLDLALLRPGRWPGLRRWHRRGRPVRSITEDAEPPGEVSVRRGDPALYATDGPIGRVQGLVIDRAATTSPTCCSRRATCGGARTWPSPSASVRRSDEGITLEHHQGAGQRPAPG